MSVDTLNIRRVGSHQSGDLELFSTAAISENARKGHEFHAVPEEPNAPFREIAANLFFKRDETGKMQCYVRFPSGATQVLATEPD